MKLPFKQLGGRPRRGSSRNRAILKIFPVAGLLWLMMVFAGCSTSPRPTESITHTLKDVPGLPLQRICLGFKPSEWERLNTLHYTGYVILEGRVGVKGDVSNLRVIDAFPDHARDTLAEEFCNEIRVAPFTIGAPMQTTARAYVVFYETPAIRSALVFGQADEMTTHARYNDSARSVLIKYY